MLQGLVSEARIPVLVSDVDLLTFKLARPALPAPGGTKHGDGLRVNNSHSVEEMINEVVQEWGTLMDCHHSGEFF